MQEAEIAVCVDRAFEACHWEKARRCWKWKDTSGFRLFGNGCESSREEGFPVPCDESHVGNNFQLEAEGLIWVRGSCRGKNPIPSRTPDRLLNAFS